jgi:hypothetical protein
MGPYFLHWLRWYIRFPSASSPWSKWTEMSRYHEPRKQVLIAVAKRANTWLTTMPKDHIAASGHFNVPADRAPKRTRLKTDQIPAKV